jgi:hypothetical protein
VVQASHGGAAPAGPGASFAGGAGEEPGPIRRLLLALVALGIVGLGAELFLLEHFEDVWQWVPLVALGAGLVCTIALALRPGRRIVRAFQAVMVVFVVAGAVGVFLHYDGNVEFEKESDASIRGVALFWSAMKGATPALAPGALAQLGLLGLILTYRHPALRPRDAARPTT